MAITAAHVRSVRLEHGGTKLAQIDITFGAASDYTVGTGVDLDSYKAVSGLGEIYAVLDASLRTSGGTWKPNVIPRFDPAAKIIRLHETVSDYGEIETGDLANGDILRVTVWGS